MAATEASKTVTCGALRSVFDLSRARQALLSVAQPAVAAVLALGDLPSSRQMVLGLVAATAGYLAVFSLNDVLDLRLDVRALAAGKGEFEGFDVDTVFSRHPIAGGRIPLAFAVAWVGSLSIVSAAAAYALEPLCLAFFAAAVALEVVYCSLHSVTWLKTFVSGAMVGVGALAGWVAVAPLTVRAIPVFAFFALWEIAGRNIPNDLSDSDTDLRTGVRTVPTVFGGRAATRAVFLGAVLTLGAATTLRLPAWGAVAPVALVGWAMVVPAIALVGRPTALQAARYFNRASLLPAVLLAVTIIALAVT